MPPKSARTLFEQALEHGPETRATFLARSCEGDAELAGKVRRLLAAHDAAGDFINAPVLESSEVPSASLIGATIGTYKVVRLIGTGGMGEVYLAECPAGRYPIRAAVKTVRWGLLSDDVLRRFGREHLILGRLKHPGIAQLRETGTTPDGVPFLLMDFVDGVPLDEHCDRQSLTVEQRLRLFLDVCSAVQYAHDQGVLHRDLKPRNILCTAAGSVTLLDFGIAKLLHSDEVLELTRTGHRALTPEYASPEQVLGADLAFTADVYSLGVILYELLTGWRPYRGGLDNFAAVVEIVGQQIPEQPSAATRSGGSASDRHRAGAGPPGDPASIARDLEGDLDAIVMKALAKAPHDRYLTVAAMRQDLERFLAFVPVAANTALGLPRLVGRWRRRLRARVDRQPTAPSIHPLVRRAMALVRQAIADTEAGQTQAAVDRFRAAVALQEEARLLQPRDARLNRIRAFTHNRLGLALARLGQRRAAADAFIEATAACELAAESDPSQARVRRSLAGNARNAAVLFEGCAREGAEEALLVHARRWFERSREELQVLKQLGQLPPTGAILLSALEERLNRQPPLTS